MSTNDYKVTIRTHRMVQATLAAVASGMFHPGLLASALEYVDAGEVTKAFDSISSDLGKHPDTANHSAIEMGFLLLMQGGLNTPEKMRSFINGFN